MSIQIDKNIPLPTNITVRRKTLYPFAAMKKGDSFWTEKSRSALSAAAQYKKNHAPGVEFVSMPEDKNTVKGSRIWRIK